MRLEWVFALCVVGAVSGAAPTVTEPTTKGTTNNRHRRSSATELFLSIVAERPTKKDNKNVPILPVQLPIQLGGEGGITLPVLVLPVPVYTNAPGPCNANQIEAGPAEKPSETTTATEQNPTPILATRQQFVQTQTTKIPEYTNPQPEEPVKVEQPKPKPQEAVKINDSPVPTPVANIPSPHGQPIEQDQQTQPEKTIETVKYQTAPKIVIPSIVLPIHGQPFVQTQLPSQETEKISHHVSPGVIPSSVNIPAPHGGLSLNLGSKVGFKVEPLVPHTPEKLTVSVQPVSSTAAPEERVSYYERSLYKTSEQMIQSFRRQSPVAPHLPAVLPDLNLPERLPVPKPSSDQAPVITASPPPRPDFNRTLRLRVDLTATKSDYTEVYDIQWHADTNTAKSVVEDGSTVIYRAPLSDGRVQFLEVQREQTADKVVRRCTLSPLIPASPADKAFPGLPEFDQFEFTGYTSAEGRSLVERWRRVVVGGPGEGGAAHGESLTFTHEMLIIRDKGLAVPLKYTVVTDSSILGPSCDSYTHRYDPLTPPTDAALPNTDEECDLFVDLQDEEQTRQKRDVKGFLSKVVSRFDPIREFAGPTRDTKYDSILDKFKDQFKRKYIDNAEEAVRKNLLVKSSRFIEAGNRLASGFKMAANFLADRLDDEIDALCGVQPLPDGSLEAETGLKPFPYSGEQLKKLSTKLEDEFDWRPLGAVSPVRFQDSCSSCWAFAVAGATKGALFKKTNKLVPLSPQCLVDCGKPYGANGCNGTWPSYAYDYVVDRGLPAWDEYTNYQARVLDCKDKSVPPVTHISGHVNVSSSESALKVAIKNHAPNVVIVDAKASSFIFYKSGVLRDKRCGENKPKLNHAVLAVGWGNKDGPHFILKNSWTANWGEAGYVRMAPEACGVMDRPSYPLIEVPNIDRKELRAAAESVKES